MSKRTNPITEQSVICGFFNSSDDRKYNAEDFGRLFDGLITDGIFGEVGDCFGVSVNTDNPRNVNVGTGKCWFNRTWTENTAILPIDCGKPNPGLDRWDAVVIRIDNTDSVRDNFIQVIHGEAAEVPVKPGMTHDEKVNDYPICYIYRHKGIDKIETNDIFDVRGTETPYVTGIPEAKLPSETLSQWRAQLDKIVEDERAEMDNETTRLREDYDDWFTDMKGLMANAIAAQKQWTTDHQNSFIDWFNEIEDQLSTDAAGSLQLQFDESDIKRILINGFIDGTKTTSEDGRTITSTDPDGRTLVKTFSDDFLTITSVLCDKHSTELGRLVKTFSSDGSMITSEFTML